MPHCTNCGKEITDEDFLYFKGVCIDCVHGTDMENGLKFTSCLCIGFFGSVFFISSFFVILSFIFDSYYTGNINLIPLLPILIFHSISVFMIAVAIKRYITIQRSKS